MRSIRPLALAALSVWILASSGKVTAQDCPNGQLPSGECLDAPLVDGRVKRAPQRVKVTSDPPGAAIFVNGEQVRTSTGTLATTPYEFTTRVAPGRQVFQLQLAGYVPIEVAATIRPNGETRVHAPLIAYGHARVWSNANCVLEITGGLTAKAGSAAVYAAELQAQEEPKELDLEPGTYRARCTNQVYFDADQPFDIKSDRTTTVEIKLEPRPVSIAVESPIPKDLLQGFSVTKIASEQAECVAPKKPVILEGSAWTLSEGVGWYCFVPYVRGHAVTAQRSAIRELKQTIALRALVAAEWESLPLYSYTSFADECLSPDSSARTPQHCAAAAQLVRARLDGISRENKQSAYLVEVDGHYGTMCESELSALEEDPSQELASKLYDASCTPDFPQGCELAGLFYRERARLTAKDADRGALIDKATNAFALGCQYGYEGACIRLYDPQREPNLAEVSLDLSCDETKPWYTRDDQDSAYLELFGGHSLGDDDWSYFFGVSLFSLEVDASGSDFFRLSIKARLGSPIVAGYTQRNLSDGTKKKRNLLGLDAATALFRGYAGPAFVEAGISAVLLWDTGGDGKLEQCGRYDLNWSGGGGLRIGDWAVSAGLRYFVAIGDIAQIEDRTLYETNGFWMPYVTLETGLPLFEL